MFVLVNEADAKVIDLDSNSSYDSEWRPMTGSWQGNQYDTYSFDNTDNYESSKEKFTNFKVLVPPSQLEGLPVLW
jgi:hypothetical protein